MLHDLTLAGYRLTDSLRILVNRLSLMLFLVSVPSFLLLSLGSLPSLNKLLPVYLPVLNLCLSFYLMFVRFVIN